jgi:pimeloyl-ACP methyl ester carboxylesterase
MEIRAGQVVVHYVEHGAGRPVLVLHGAGVNHREAEACFELAFEGVAGLRRIYPDLPGMGRTIAPETLRSADDVLDTLLDFADEVIGGTAHLLSVTRRARTSRRRWPRGARRRSLVWRSAVRCCQDCATSPSTASSPDRV